MLDVTIEVQEAKAVVTRPSVETVFEGSKEELTTKLASYKNQMDFEKGQIAFHQNALAEWQTKLADLQGLQTQIEKKIDDAATPPPPQDPSPADPAPTQ